MRENVIGIVFINKHTGEYLTWVEMTPTWVSEFKDAYVQTDPYQLLVDIVTLKRHGINDSDYMLLYVNDNTIIRVIDLDKNAII